jgi:hypothetical protein
MIDEQRLVWIYICKEVMLQRNVTSRIQFEIRNTQSPEIQNE